MNEINLEEFKSLGKLQNGSYTDNYGILIKPNRKKTKWYLYEFDEVDGTKEFISEIKSNEHLKELYFSIYFKELY